MGENGKIRVGIKAGCFTLLHAGHVRALQYCAEHCDYLIVLTNTDDKIFRKKGCVPISLEERMTMLRAIKGVDLVCSFKKETEEEWVRNFKYIYANQLGDCELIVFHDPEVPEPIPCKDVADKIVFVPHLPADGPKYSVSDMFAIIRGDE